MPYLIGYFLIHMSFLGCMDKKNTSPTKNSYPAIIERTAAKANTTFYIDPNKGDDSNLGTAKEHPWKTFKRVNQLLLTKGNTIKILSAGDFKESLFLIGKGSKENPITVKFARGKYNFYPEKAYKKTFHISNTNDAPDSLKTVAFYFLEAENVQIKGHGADIIFRGKTIEMGIDNSKNISIQNLSFDYHRPTVSEFKVVKTTAHFADIEIHPDSKYKIVDSTLTWVGEGWEHKPHPLWQEFNTETETVARKYMPYKKLLFSETEKNKVRIYFDKNLGFAKGFIYQNRNTFRDYAAFFMNRSKNIRWTNVKIHFMHGMGIVSQYCENITFDSLSVKPKENSGRTCAAWADILHFSGCKGDIVIQNSFLSAANDDAINVHGTHLRIVETLSDKKIKVRFMHPQTYGFKAFQAGDSIEFIRNSSLLPYSKNKVITAKMLNKKEMELVLEQTVPKNIQPKDVLENTTWTPNVIITNTKIMHIPTRGILVTTRGKVRIENNEFLKTTASAILISDDADSWFESGYVMDIVIKNNTFIECGEPVINIHPENKEMEEGAFVHRNIHITDNLFKTKKEKVLSVKSTDRLQFSSNVIEVNKTVLIDDLLFFKKCKNIEIYKNKINNKNEK